MAKNNRVAKNEVGATLNMIDLERFTEIRERFAARGLGELPLSMMMRIVIDEWAARERAERPAFPALAK